MKQWLATLIAIAACIAAPVSFATSGGPNAPTDCVPSIDKPTLPASGGTVKVGINCPNPHPDGFNLQLFGPDAPSASISGSPPAGAVTNTNFVIAVDANTGSTPQVFGWYWRICDFTKVSCNNSATVTTTVAAPSAVPICSLGASNLTPTIGQSITITATCSNSPTSYTWTAGCTSTSSTCNDTNNVVGNKTYTMFAANGGGNSAPASVVVNWRPPVPVCSVSPSNATPTIGQAITLTATCSNSPTSYFWTAGCSSSSSTCNDTNNVVGNKTYTVIANNAGGSGAAASAIVDWRPLGPRSARSRQAMPRRWWVSRSR